MTQLEVTSLRLSTGSFSFTLYVCKRPCLGVKSTHLGIYETNYAYYVATLKKGDVEDVKLLPTVSLASKYQKKLENEGKSAVTLNVTARPY